MTPERYGQLVACLGRFYELVLLNLLNQVSRGDRRPLGAEDRFRRDQVHPPRHHPVPAATPHHARLRHPHLRAARRWHPPRGQAARPGGLRAAHLTGEGAPRPCPPDALARASDLRSGVRAYTRCRAMRSESDMQAGTVARVASARKHAKEVARWRTPDRCYHAKAALSAGALPSRERDTPAGAGPGLGNSRPRSRGAKRSRRHPADAARRATLTTTSTIRVT
jgi:hypothetical protein